MENNNRCGAGRWRIITGRARIGISDFSTNKPIVLLIRTGPSTPYRYNYIIDSEKEEGGMWV